MWKGLNIASHTGYATAVGNIEFVIDSISRLLSEPSTLVEMSNNARIFALSHTFEREFEFRVKSILNSSLTIDTAP